MSLSHGEEQELSGEEIYRRLRARGISIKQLASEAGIADTHVSSALRGRELLSAQAQKRLEHTLVRLGLDQPGEPRRLGVFRVRREGEEE